MNLLHSGRRKRFSFALLHAVGLVEEPEKLLSRAANSLEITSIKK